MNGTHETQRDTHASSGAPAGHGDDGAAHGSRAVYLTGFAVSVVLTAIPFGLVVGGGRASSVVPAIVAMAVAQILVHLRCFLHFDGSDRQAWALSTFVFTVLIVAILVGGSLWIMANVAHHMMAL